jgi:hypothetical protein
MFFLKNISLIHHVFMRIRDKEKGKRRKGGRNRLFKIKDKVYIR